MESIEKKVVEIIANEANIIQNNQTLRDFQKASKDFQLLIEKGLVEHRGNNLLPIDEVHLKRCVFNTI